MGNIEVFGRNLFQTANNTELNDSAVSNTKTNSAVYHSATTNGLQNAINQLTANQSSSIELQSQPNLLLTSAAAAPLTTGGLGGALSGLGRSVQSLLGVLGRVGLGRANLWVLAAISIPVIIRTVVAGIDWARAAIDANYARQVYNNTAESFLDQLQAGDNPNLAERASLYRSIADDSNLDSAIRERAQTLYNQTQQEISRLQAQRAAAPSYSATAAPAAQTPPLPSTEFSVPTVSPEEREREIFRENAFKSSLENAPVIGGRAAEVGVFNGTSIISSQAEANQLYRQMAAESLQSNRDAGREGYEIERTVTYMQRYEYGNRTVILPTRVTASPDALLRLYERGSITQNDLTNAGLSVNGLRQRVRYQELASSQAKRDEFVPTLHGQRLGEIALVEKPEDVQRAYQTALQNSFSANQTAYAANGSEFSVTYLKTAEYENGDRITVPVTVQADPQTLLDLSRQREFSETDLLRNGLSLEGLQSRVAPPTAREQRNQLSPGLGEPQAQPEQQPSEVIPGQNPDLGIPSHTGNTEPPLQVPAHTGQNRAEIDNLNLERPFFETSVPDEPPRATSFTPSPNYGPHQGSRMSEIPVLIRPSENSNISPTTQAWNNAVSALRNGDYNSPAINNLRVETGGDARELMRQAFGEGSMQPQPAYTGGQDGYPPAGRYELHPTEAASTAENNLVHIKGTGPNGQTFHIAIGVEGNIAGASIYYQASGGNTFSQTEVPLLTESQFASLQDATGFSRAELNELGFTLDTPLVTPNPIIRYRNPLFVPGNNGVPQNRPPYGENNPYINPHTGQPRMP